MRAETVQDAMSTEMLEALARSMGFRMEYDRTPGADRWTISAGHGESHVQYQGTKRAIAAFLHGYAAMRTNAMTEVANLEIEQRKVIDQSRHRLFPTD